MRIVIIVAIALVGLVAFFVFVSPPYDHKHQATHNVSTSKRGDNVTVYHGIDIGAIQRTGNVSVPIWEEYLGIKNNSASVLGSTKVLSEYDCRNKMFVF